MDFKVILTPQSLSDLEEIVRFIAKDNPERARTFGNELINRALSLQSFPERGRMVPEIGEPSVREIIHGDYRIIYETFPAIAAVYILRLWISCSSKLSAPRGHRPTVDGFPAFGFVES